ncbi:MAG: NAD(P)/FAD-dependent oxidoreductase [Gammaproteobacteria bacterium]|nr:MAG: NAD(P)/FAD-dependent oxidoreductase [Gammaproteobacteria bacterium]
MSTSYDLIVIGTGTAASNIAHTCRARGWTVAVTDYQPFGGTCANRGCDPKKVLVAAADAMDAAERMAEKGVVNGELNIDWGALQTFKRTFTDTVPSNSEKSFKANGIDTFHERVHFTGPNELRVGDLVLQAKYIVIASGAEPVKLPVEGAEHLVDSTGFLELSELPQRVVFVGGGYIGFEFAHVVARAGAMATILNRGVQPLKQFDPDLVGLLVERSRALGIDVLTGHTVLSVEKHKRAYRVHVRTPDGEQTFDADLVVHSGGRIPAIGDLNLDAGRVIYDGVTIKLNKYLQSTSNPAVYVAGDAANTGYPLTPIAAQEGRAVAANLLEGNHSTVNYKGIPSAVFTVPALAAVGLLESQAREQNLNFRVKYESVPGWYTARRVNETAYAFKVLVEEGSEKILGAHLLGPDSAEVINIYALAIRTGLKVADLKDARFVYPTPASDIAYMLP